MLVTKEAYDILISMLGQPKYRHLKEAIVWGLQNTVMTKIHVHQDTWNFLVECGVKNIDFIEYLKSFEWD